MQEWQGRVGIPSLIVPETGEVIRPEPFYACPEPIIDADDPYDVEIKTIVMDGVTHEVHHSHRVGMPLRIRSNPGLGMVDWMRPVLGANVDGIGQSFLVNEAMSMNITGGVAQFIHNPTYGGCSPEALILIGDNAGSALTRPLVRPSPCLHSRVVVEGNSLRSEGAVVPMEFDSHGQEGGIADDHGGDYRTAVLWWRMRQFGQLTMNWAGRAHWHKFVAWSYFPREIRPDLYAFLLFMRSGFNWSNTMQPSMHWYDPATRVRTPWGADWDTNLMTPNTFEIIANTEVESWSGSVNKTLSSPWPLGDAGIIVESTAGPSCVIGALCKIKDHSGAMKWPHQVQQNKLFNGAVVPDNIAGGEVTFDHAANQTNAYRRAGWIGHEWWFTVRATLPEVTDVLDDMYAAGVHDQPPPFAGVVPAHVARGLPGPAWGR